MKKTANIVLNDFTNDSRVLKTSQTLKKLGFVTTVVAIHNDGLIEEESVHGVAINRIKLRSRPWSKSKPVQLIKYLEFLFRAVCRFRNADIIHCNDLNALPVGLLIKTFFKEKKVVYDCHEYETEIKGLSGVEKGIRRWLESFLIRYADTVITVSDSIAKEYQRLYSIDKPQLVLNCPRFFERSKEDLFRESLGIRSDQKIFLYQGGLSQGRGIELLLEAFSNLESDKSVLVCMGYGHLEDLIKEKAQLQSTIFFHPAVTPEVLLRYTGSADYGILFYEDTCLNHRYCSPNKIFEYLMAGLPVLTSNLFEMKRLVEEEGIGIVAEDNTVEGFKKAVEALLNQDYGAIQENVFKSRKKYCWEEQENVLKEIYYAL
ncbi:MULTISPECIES: glycosyltransferase family 4 protein [unclassified Salinivibrio]|uniref:glycosyltransferase family 4 protein n=1 Tax=unclassified Salinivibrio TaxID=2636825 RepID=UPI00128C50AE|nr:MULTISPECIES: glycosyltransferase family 4 protein [unclassified Salinivibrio]MPS32395.1 glycosyltransferase [Salinivibrio sp. VYel7]MPX90682.1 glycosyltransferase [Salinivibrio sp. VYel1]MPX93788.1 glycosyltransferase [Salinivibrio sp. VYel9]MPX96025.1 glycosyltransferase [Salinivibrio sp. VYel6]MPY00253.1 glycosyltransferase [Salinivibrio sp. VYel4]